MRIWSVDDVMSPAVVTVGPAATYRAIVDLLIGRRISAVPVVDETLHVLGVLSETDLVRKIEYAGDERPRLLERGRRRDERAKAAGGTAAALMSAPAVVAPTGMSLAAAARRMDAAHVKRLPVTDEQGRLIGIVTRSDLLKAHLRPDDELQDDVRDGMLSAYFADTVTGVQVGVGDGVVTLTGEVSTATTAESAAWVTRQVPGVVSVVNELAWVSDDRPHHTQAPRQPLRPASWRPE